MLRRILNGEMVVEEVTRAGRLQSSPRKGKFKAILRGGRKKSGVEVKITIQTGSEPDPL